MEYVNPLELVWESYQTVQRSIDFVFHLQDATWGAESAGLAPLETIPSPEDLAGGQMHLDDSTVVVLWAVFERHFRNLLIGQVRYADDNPGVLSRSVRNLLFTGMERWRVDDLLGILKRATSEGLVGELTRIWEHRNWVAHRNPKFAPSTKTPRVAPGQAFRTLSQALEELRLYN